MGSLYHSEKRAFGCHGTPALQDMPSLLGSDGGEDNIYYGRLPEHSHLYLGLATHYPMAT